MIRNKGIVLGSILALAAFFMACGVPKPGEPVAIVKPNAGGLSIYVPDGALSVAATSSMGGVSADLYEISPTVARIGPIGAVATPLLPTSRYVVVPSVPLGIANFSNGASGTSTAWTLQDNNPPTQSITIEIVR